MSDLLKKLFNHERYQSITVIIAACFLLWLYGCQSKCESLLTPGLQVTRSELNLELSSIVQMAELRSLNLDQQDQFRNLVFEQAMLSAGGTALNPFTVITGIGAILGFGAGIDNVRKRKEIKNLKSNVT